MIFSPFVRNPYNYDQDLASDESGLECTDVSLAKQSMAEESDINTIVRRFHLTGELPTNVRMPQYGDFEEVYDFHSAMNAIRSAEASFMAMPAEFRARFHNDPNEFLAFCSDNANYEEARKLGLVPPEEVVKAADLVSGSPAAAPAAAPAAPAAPGTVST